VQPASTDATIAAETKLIPNWRNVHPWFNVDFFIVLPGVLKER
jgi:hypothetical protein